MTYLFDIGNVLLSFDFEPALSSLKGPNPDPSALEKIIEAKDPFEAGQTSISEYLAFVSPLLDFQGSPEDFYKAWNSIFTPIPATWELLKSLSSKGHRIILFSNINPIHAPYLLETHDVFEYADKAAFSFELGAIKPEKAFFTRAFEAFDIIPEDTIYIDDLPQNIDMGKQLGLHSFCYDYNKHSELTEWLQQFPQSI